MSKTFLGNFPQTANVPPNMAAHPNSIQIFGFRLFIDASFIGIPIVSPNDINSVYSTWFYCNKCNKWLKLSGTIGNIRSHLRNVHPEVQQIEHTQISSFGRAQLFREFCLITGLPFRIIDHPIIQKLFPEIGNRHDLSNLCTDVSGKIQNYLKVKLQSALHISIAMDEWTDQCNRRYLGIQAICIFRDAYEILTLAQTPILEVNASASVLSSILKKNLKKYDIKLKVDYVVSDTTAVMPATAIQLGLKWSPCYCHILNLVAGDFTKCISLLVGPILEIQKTLGRSTLFTQFCIQKNQGFFQSRCQQKHVGIAIIKHSMLLSN